MWCQFLVILIVSVLVCGAEFQEWFRNLKSLFGPPEKEAETNFIDNYDFIIIGAGNISLNYINI